MRFYPLKNYLYLLQLFSRNLFNQKMLKPIIFLFALLSLFSCQNSVQNEYEILNEVITELSESNNCNLEITTQISNATSKVELTANCEIVEKQKYGKILLSMHEAFKKKGRSYKTYTIFNESNDKILSLDSNRIKVILDKKEQLFYPTLELLANKNYEAIKESTSIYTFTKADNDSLLYNFVSSFPSSFEPKFYGFELGETWIEARKENLELITFFGYDLNGNKFNLTFGTHPNDYDIYGLEFTPN